MALLVELFPARKDNIGYLVHDVATGKTAAIDAPDEEAIEAALRRRGWTLTDIFITHHHLDHVEAIPALKRTHQVTVTGPMAEAQKIPGLDVMVAGGDGVSLGATDFYVIDTPGHTAGHIVFFEPAGRRLFSADALFSLGVGRLFEGNPEQMWSGLSLIRSLPDDTLIFCGHEYTLDNAAFALSVDPNNVALTLRAKEVRRMRQSGQFTVPVSLALEKATNPFLRADQPALRTAMGIEAGTPAYEVFGALRRAKDAFKIPDAAPPVVSETELPPPPGPAPVETAPAPMADTVKTAAPAGTAAPRRAPRRKKSGVAGAKQGKHAEDQQ